MKLSPIVDHAYLLNVTPDQHHARDHKASHQKGGADDLESLLQLANFSDRSHNSLTNVTPSQHHTKTSKLSEITIDMDKDWAGKAINSPGNVDGVDISAHAANAGAHHAKYTNAEAVAAVSAGNLTKLVVETNTLVADGGKVGIGTTVPEGMLTIGTANPTINLGNTGVSSTDSLIGRAVGANYHVTGTAIGDLAIRPEATKKIVFGTTPTAGAVGVARLMIDTSGNVSIVSGNLDIAGNISTKKSLIIYPQADNAWGIVEVSRGGNLRYGIQATAWRWSFLDGANNEFFTVDFPTGNVTIKAGATVSGANCIPVASVKTSQGSASGAIPTMSNIDIVMNVKSFFPSMGADTGIYIVTRHIGVEYTSQFRLWNEDPGTRNYYIGWYYLS